MTPKLLLLATLVSVALLWTPAGTVGAFLLVWLLPIFTWRLWLPGREITTAGLVILFNLLLTLLLALWPGGVGRTALLTIALVVLWLPQFGQRFSKIALQPFPQLSKAMLPGALVLLLALGLRLGNMGYKEFQGDEGIIMMRAAAILAGDEQELFLHQKGPAEILLPMTIWGLSGRINEFWARLPFTWASCLAVAAVMSLAWRWFGRPAGIIAGLLFALNGFAIAFGRIVQYQSLVMLWGSLALLQADHYRDTGRRIDLLLAALFAAGGLLAHYDTVLVLPAVAWLVWRRRQWADWLPAGAIGLLVLAIFYLPFILSPNFANTSRYLLGDRVGEGWLKWSFPAGWQMATFYNSTWFMIGLFIFALGGAWLAWRQRSHFALLLALAVPLFFYTFLVADPRTHVYTIFPALTILAAGGASHIRLHWSWLALFALVSGLYVYLMFVDSNPERQRTWAENRPTFYPVTWQEPPTYGLFGFPYQAGWRLAADLLPALPYASNEEGEITNWYMAQAPRTYCSDFETFIVAENVQDSLPFDPAGLQSLFLRYQITVNGQPKMAIYSRTAGPEPQMLEAVGSGRWLTPAQMAPLRPEPQYPLAVELGPNQTRLLGYDLDTGREQQLLVTLYWQSLAPFAQNYQVYVHLADTTLRAQHDGAPACAIYPTTRWEPGQIIRDPHLIELPADLPAGTYQLTAGMYELVTLQPLQPATIPLQPLTISP